MTNTSSLFDRVAPAEHYPETDQRRRARILSASAAVITMVGLLRGGMFLLVGNVGEALWLLGAATVGALSLVGVRRGWPLRTTGNLLVTVMFVTCCRIALFRGGIGSPVLTGLGVVPLLVTLLAGWRSGLAWAAVAVAAVLGMAAAQNVGLLTPDQLTGALAFRFDVAATVAIPAVLAVVGVTYEWAKGAALAEREEAEHGRQVAIEDARLLRADRMASMGVLAAGIGHEINNPLTYVLSNLEFLREALDDLLPAEGPEREDVDQLVSEALEGADRIRRIVRDLKAFTRLDTNSSFHPFPAERAMQAALSLTRNQVKHHARLTCDFAEVPRVSGEEYRLVQVFVNLLLNASLALQSEGATGDGLHLSIQHDGEQVVITVQDDGPGISPEDQARIFEPFFTTRPAGQGTGLGLPVSLGIVREMGGTLMVESTPGAGAAFTVRLPAVVRPEVRREDVELPIIRGSYHILVVDDEPGVARSLARMLRQHSVDLTSSAEEAEERLAEIPFDLIFCDLMMPGTSGAALYHSVQLQQPELAERFVFITGGAFSPEARQLIEQTILPVLSKPLLARDVLSAVARLEGAQEAARQADVLPA